MPVCAARRVSGVGERNSGGDIVPISWSGFRRKEIEVADDELAMGMCAGGTGRSRNASAAGMGVAGRVGTSGAGVGGTGTCAGSSAGSSPSSENARE